VVPSLTRILDARGAQRVSFSPDGLTLYYVTEITGTMQLWSLRPYAPAHSDPWAAPGFPRRLTYDCDRVGNYYDQRHGRRLVYEADEGGNERWALWDVDGAGEARRVTDRPDRIHHVVDLPRGSYAFANLRDERYFDLYRFTEVGTPEIVFRNDGTGFGATGFEDGRIVVTTNRGRSDRNHLTLVDQNGETRQLTPNEPEAMHGDAQAFGDAILVRSDRDRDLVGIARIDLDGSFRYVVEAKHEVEDLVVTGGRFAYALNVDGYSEVHVVEAGKDRTLSSLPRGALATDLIGKSLALAADGTVAVALARFHEPSEIYLVGPDGTAELAVPAQMAVPANELPNEELVSWRSFDGRTIPGFLLRPRGAPNGPQPTVVQVHGGPEGQARPLWNPLTVALVAAGFNVLQPNVRGSSGYGRAYMSLDDVRLRMDSVRDLDAAAAWLAESGVAPADRIGVIGGSYGGFMTLAAITFCADRRWAAAVDIVGIASFTTFFARTAPWRRPLRAAEYGDPEKDVDFLESISPLNFIDRIQAPLMVIHGANDPRVPVEEAEQIVSTLRARGRAVDYLRYEDEGHGLAKAKNRADAWPKVVRFFEKHMGPAG